MRRRGFLLGLAAPLAACAARAPVQTRPRPYVRRGLASWYGADYQGKPTASGEPFDLRHLTAAHYDLPFGTQVQVRNLRNRRQVVVRINDRFPRETLDKGRILDVSYAAAQRLRMVEDGVVPVEISVRSWP